MKNVPMKGIITPILTPMNPDETVNLEVLRQQIERLIQGGVQFGSVVDDDEELPGHGPSASLNSRRHLNRPRPKRQGPPASPNDETDGP